MTENPSCPNRRCSDYGILGDNVVKYGRRKPRYLCTTCKRTFRVEGREFFTPRKKRIFGILTGLIAFLLLAAYGYFTGEPNFILGISTKDLLTTNVTIVLMCAFLGIIFSSVQAFLDRLYVLEQGFKEVIEESELSKWDEGLEKDLERRTWWIYAVLLMIIIIPIHYYFFAKDYMIPKFGNRFDLWLVLVVILVIPLLYKIAHAIWIMTLEWFHIFTFQASVMDDRGVRKIFMATKPQRGYRILKRLTPCTHVHPVHVHIKPFHLDGAGGLGALVSLGSLGTGLLLVTVIFGGGIITYNNLSIGIVVLFISALSLPFIYYLVIKGIRFAIKTEKGWRLAKIRGNLEQLSEEVIFSEKLDPKKVEEIYNTLQVINLMFLRHEAIKEWPIDVPVILKMGSSAIMPIGAFLIRFLF